MRHILNRRTCAEAHRVTYRTTDEDLRPHHPTEPVEIIYRRVGHDTYIPRHVSYALHGLEHRLDGPSSHPLNSPPSNPPLYIWSYYGKSVATYGHVDWKPAYMVHPMYHSLTPESYPAHPSLQRLQDVYGADGWS